jgi:cytochrome c6
MYLPAVAPVTPKVIRKMGATIAAVALTGAIMAAPASAFDAELGKEVFSGNCAACHTGGNNSVMPDKTLKKAALEKYLEGGFNLNAIVYQVQILTYDNGMGLQLGSSFYIGSEIIVALY